MLLILSWTTQSMVSGVHGVPGVAVHGPVAVVCGHVPDSATTLRESWAEEGGRVRLLAMWVPMKATKHVLRVSFCGPWVLI